VQSLAHDLTAPQADLVDAVRLARTTVISHVVDQKHA
jgi:hypothetical protein